MHAKSIGEYISFFEKFTGQGAKIKVLEFDSSTLPVWKNLSSLFETFTWVCSFFGLKISCLEADMRVWESVSDFFLFWIGSYQEIGRSRWISPITRNVCVIYAFLLLITWTFVFQTILLVVYAQGLNLKILLRVKIYWSSFFYFCCSYLAMSLLEMF